jgi:hypothetical protein
VVVGREDCLTLGVFSPTTRPGRRLPVVVNIHGGAFAYGDYTAYGPQHLLDKVANKTLFSELAPSVCRTWCWWSSPTD